MAESVLRPSVVILSGTSKQIFLPTPHPHQYQWQWIEKSESVKNAYVLIETKTQDYKSQINQVDPGSRYLIFLIPWIGRAIIHSVC